MHMYLHVRYRNFIESNCLQKSSNHKVLEGGRGERKKMEIAEVVNLPSFDLDEPSNDGLSASNGASVICSSSVDFVLEIVSRRKKRQNGMFITAIK